MATLRHLLLALMAPMLTAAAEARPVPTGYQLSLLRPGEFQIYVSGIYEGQVLMAKMAGITPAVCVDPTLTRADVAMGVLQALPELSHEAMTLEASVVVLTVLMRQHGCPAGQQQIAARSPQVE